MNKFTQLSLVGSTAMIGLIAVGSIMIYVSVVGSQTCLPIDSVPNKPVRVDTVKVIEKSIIRDTVFINRTCERTHCEDRPAPAKQPQVNHLDSIQKDSQTPNEN